MALKPTLLACVLALPTFLLNGQSAYTPDASLLPLAHKITYNIANDSDKVVAIYQWMCKNLTYDYDSDAHGATKNEEWQRPAMVVQRKKRRVRWLRPFVPRFMSIEWHLCGIYCRLHVVQ